MSIIVGDDDDDDNDDDDDDDDDNDDNDAESQKQRRRVGIADRKVFARAESFCAYLQNYP